MRMQATGCGMGWGRAQVPEKLTPPSRPPCSRSVASVAPLASRGGLHACACKRLAVEWVRGQTTYMCMQATGCGFGVGRDCPEGSILNSACVERATGIGYDPVQG